MFMRSSVSTPEPPAPRPEAPAILAARSIRSCPVQSIHRKRPYVLAITRQALKEGLQPADHAYARSLVAENTPEAIECLEAALAHDPYHHRANGMLGLLLLFLGRLDEARIQIAAGG